MNTEIAAQEHNLSSGESIIQVCKGKGNRLTAAGFKWKYNSY